MGSASHPPRGPRTRGRPKIHSESWTRVSVLLFVRHLEFLDRLSAAARTPGVRALSRADILRALIDALEESRVTLPAGSTADDVRLKLTERLSLPQR
jgi:hypothetical protein